ncbi:hypothetical protein CALVIDRAFT_49686 [Calocera viscosa TUFC12733]|uniref:Uncharacterized protein n=1 Tax=Calocera viscosa (strain TUFC12733) TaxID=1330018 RepID=A0A167NR38_CALVF|nr:hypothetical protein CALVIDRAFT_49686 [Calocera viscosa TUFC12733]
MGKKRRASGHSDTNGGSGDHHIERRETSAWQHNPTSTSNDSDSKLNMYNRNGGDEEQHITANAQTTSYGARPSQHSSHYASDDRRDYRRPDSPSRMDYRYDSRVDRGEYGADRSGWRANDSHHGTQRPTPNSYYREDAFPRREDHYYRDSGSSSRAPQGYGSGYWPPSDASRYPPDDRREWRGREQSSYAPHPPAIDAWERSDSYGQTRHSDDHYAHSEARADPYVYSRPVDDRYSHSQQPHGSNWPPPRREESYDDRYSRNVPEPSTASWAPRERERERSDGSSKRARPGQWDKRDDRRPADDSSWEPAPGWKERGGNTARDDNTQSALKKKKKKKQREKNKEKRRESEGGLKERDRGLEDAGGRQREGRKNEKPQNGSRRSDDEKEYQSRKRRKSASRSPSRAASPLSPAPKRPRLSTPEPERDESDRTMREERGRSRTRSPVNEMQKVSRVSDPASKRKRAPSSSRSGSRSPSSSPSLKITPTIVRPLPTGPRQTQIPSGAASDQLIPKGPRAAATGNGTAPGAANSSVRRFFPGDDEDSELVVPTASRGQTSRGVRAILCGRNSI